jgi:hypothetical protein
MAQELSLLDQPANLPAHLQGYDSGMTGALMAAVGGVALNRIGTKGNRFRQVIRGEEVGVFDENYLDVIILGAAPDVSRRYYGAAYDQTGDNAPPVCYSADGKKPNEDVHQKQSTTCDTCPQNVKGSKMSEGGLKTKACSYFRRLVIMLAGDTEGLLYRLDVTAMGLFGESHSKEQKYALNDYSKALLSRNLDAGAVVTRLSFDTDQSVPKLLFKAMRYISPEDVEVISGIRENSTAELEQYLEISMKTVDISGEADEAPPAAAEPAVQKPVVQKPAVQRAAAPAPQKPAPVQIIDDEPAPVAKPAVQKPAVQRAAAPTAKPTVVQSKPVVAPVVVEAGNDEELADILGGLGL